MSLTLGEKLRQAREERGFTISEVAEQTRISSLYLESIENDDYRILPGGIFNKGFVKTYAKFVGLNEQEAMMDYSQLMASGSADDSGELKPYKPQVLTDDHSTRSMVPTVIAAIVILGIMTAAILYGLRYLRDRSEQPVASRTPGVNTNSATDTPGAGDGDLTKSAAPDMSTLKVEFKATTQPVSLTAVVDGEKSSSVVIPGSLAIFTPKDSLKLSYSKSLANFVQLTINGKSITLPLRPSGPKRSVIEFEIANTNLAQIWTSGMISTDDPGANGQGDANLTAQPTPPARPAPMARPTAVANTTQPSKPSVTPKTTPKPAATIKPPANRT